jgi:protein FrlC
MTNIRMSQIAGMNEHYRLYPLNYFLDSMVELEIQSIELWAGSPHLYIEDISLSQVSQIRKQMERRGLQLICYTPEQCMYPFNIAAKEDCIREKSIHYFVKSIDAAAELGATLFQTVPGWGYFDEPVEEAWKRASESLSILSRKAEELGIIITLEPLERRGTNLITDLPSLKQMLEEVNSPHLKAIIDTCPMAAVGETFDDYFNEFGEDVRHIHFVDSKHCSWGDGSLLLGRYLKQLGDYGYTGYLTLEICARHYFADPGLAVRNSMERIRQVLNQE